MSAAETLITEHLDIWSSAIKAKSSSGRGGAKKEEFYGIKKLRGLILELAARGLLVAQDSNDEPASELLKRIEKRRSALIEDGLVKKHNSPLSVSEDEAPFNLPNGWRWVRLSNIAYPQAGFAFKSNGFNEAERGLPLVRIRDVGQPFTGTYFDGTFREEFAINNGDYLISMDGNFRVAPWILGKALLNQRVARLIFFGEEHSRAFCAISLQLRLSELQGVKAYTTVDHLSGEQISDSVIAFPPRAEQDRIVAKVGELMALCDQFEQQQEDSRRTHCTLVQTLLGALTAARERGDFKETWQRIESNFDSLFTSESSIDQLKQTILQLAVMGKLVEQDPKDESASDLLNKVASERARLFKAGKLKKQKPLPLISSDETPFDIPKQWAWCKFGLVGEFINGDRSKNYPNKSEYVDEGMPWINTGHIEPDGTLTKSSMNYITREKYDSLSGGKVEPGDLVYCLRGATFGKTAFITPYSEGAIASSLMIIRPHIVEFGNYIYRYLISPFGRSQIFRFDNGSAQPNLSANSVTMYAFPLPPLAEQHRIMAKVDELMILCDRLKAKLATAQATQLNLADSVFEAAIQ